MKKDTKKKIKFTVEFTEEFYNVSDWLVRRQMKTGTKAVNTIREFIIEKYDQYYKENNLITCQSCKKDFNPKEFSKCPNGC